MSKQKVVLFCRSATKSQIAFQLERLTQYAKVNDCEVVAVVTERSNGVYARRWKLNLAMRLAQKHSAGILIANMSRVSRETAMAEKILQRMKHRRIQLYTTDDGVGLDMVDVMLRQSNMVDLCAFPYISIV